MAVPDWLTKNFFQTCIQYREEEPITVTNIKTESAVEPGNNYGSVMVRANIDYTKASLNSSICLIVKTPLSSLEEKYGFMYDNEVAFYNKFIPKTYNYIKHDLVPKHYSSPIPRCIVLEDLCNYGYKMVDRYDLLDLEHCKLYIKAKAKLNALSVAVYKEEPELIDLLLGGTNENILNFRKNMCNGSLKCMIAYLEDKPDYQEFLDIFKECFENDTMWTMYREEEEESNKPLKSFVQIDPWGTNLMFKYNSLGTPDGVKLLDFQNVAYQSPVAELVTFLNISPNMEVRKQHCNSLCNLFCDELNGNLAKLECPERLSIEQLKDEMVNLMPLKLFIICASLPICMFEGGLDCSDYFTGNIFNVPVKESPIFKAYQGVRFDTIILQVLDELDIEEAFGIFKDKLKQEKGNHSM